MMSLLQRNIPRDWELAKLLTVKLSHQPASTVSDGPMATEGGTVNRTGFNSKLRANFADNNGDWVT